jgi:glyoxylase I family protein
MKIEHTAYQVEDPVAVARWYVEHLGLTVKRAQNERPFGQFLADDGDAVMLEFYNNPKVRVPDYRAIDPLILHIAFWTDDVDATRTRLLTAGASPEGEALVTPAGDHVAMLRDPWGLAIQFVHRAQPMIG